MIITVASFKGGVGKTTTAIHLAAYLQMKAPTLLADGDLNNSAVQWGKEGKLPFKIVDEKSIAKHIRSCEHVVIDTPARPSQEDWVKLANGCDLLVIPTSPDALALGATLQMLSDLQQLDTEYKLLLTMVPPAPSTAGAEARQTLLNLGLPVFKTPIKRYAAFPKAALEGVPVYQAKDSYAKIAWRSYVAVGQEILP